MKSVLALGVPFAFFALFALAIWYVGARLHKLFGTTSRWPTETAGATWSTAAEARH